MLENLKPGDEVFDVDVDVNAELTYILLLDERPQLNLRIEWTYNINLDHLTFILDDKVYFNLEEIPRGPDHDEWIRYIQLDGSSDRCINPLAPREYFFSPDSCLSREEQTHALCQFTSASPKIIDPATWTKTKASRSVLNTLTLFTFANLVEDSYGVLSSLVYKYKPTTPLFIVPAQYLLNIAAPGILHLTEERAMDRSGSDPYRDKRGRELHSTFHPTIHLWFRNCLVIMADNLDDEDWCKCWIGIAIEKLNAARQEGSTVTALLWSVYHAVAVVISDEGVSHSKPVSIIAAFKVDDDAFVNGVDFLMHFLKPSFIEFTSVNVKVPSLTNDTAYMNTKLRLPFDVVVRILDFVDIKTYNSCNLLSKAYRVYWSRHPRIGQLKLSKARPNRKEDISNYDMPLLGVSRCDDFSSSSPMDMYLFHPNVKFYRGENDNAKQPGMPFYTQIRIYDPILTLPTVHRIEFMMVTMYGTDHATDYLIPAKDIGQRFGKAAFHHTFEHLREASCNAYRKTEVDIGFYYYSLTFWVDRKY